MPLFLFVQMLHCSFQYKKAKKSSNILVKELRTINLMDSLLSLLTLQNALLIANGGISPAMHILTIWTSAGVFTEIVIITILSFVRVRRA